MQVGGTIEATVCSTLPEGSAHAGVVLLRLAEDAAGSATRSLRKTALQESEAEAQVAQAVTGAPIDVI